MLPYQLLIFDWDGTLIDSTARIVHCAQLTAGDMGLAIPEKQAIRGLIGLGIYNLAKMLYPEMGEHYVLKFQEIYRRHFFSDDVEESVIFDGVKETLQSLKAQNYLLAVATGKSRYGLDKDLKDTGLGSLFSATRCADEAFAKPHPQMLLDVLDVLNVEPKDAVMIGDTEYDLQTAMNANIDAIAVRSGAHGDERLAPLNPVAILDDVNELSSL